MGFPIVSVLIMLVLAAGMFYGQAQYKKKKAEWGKTLTILCGILIIVTALYTNLCRSPIDKTAIEREKQYQDAQAIVLAANLAQMYQDYLSNAVAFALGCIHFDNPSIHR